MTQNTPVDAQGRLCQKCGRSRSYWARNEGPGSLLVSSSYGAAQAEMCRARCLLFERPGFRCSNPSLYTDEAQDDKAPSSTPPKVKDADDSRDLLFILYA